MATIILVVGGVVVVVVVEVVVSVSTPPTHYVWMVSSARLLFMTLCLSALLSLSTAAEASRYRYPKGSSPSMPDEREEEEVGEESE